MRTVAVATTTRHEQDSQTRLYPMQTPKVREPFAMHSRKMGTSMADLYNLKSWVKRTSAKIKAQPIKSAHAKGAEGRDTAGAVSFGNENAYPAWIMRCVWETSGKENKVEKHVAFTSFMSDSSHLRIICITRSMKGKQTTPLDSLCLAIHLSWLHHMHQLVAIV